jgi:hypothetical protein
MSKNIKISVQGTEITILKQDDDNDYVSLTDMVKGFEGEQLIKKWLRNKNTIEFLGVWESINNAEFNMVEFDHIKNNAGTNRFLISVNQWVEKTEAIGLFSKAGRYGGTYAHKDIAIEFGAWLSPVFRLHLIKEFQRLKQIENNEYNIEWTVKRALSTINYQLHTDAIQEHIIPKLKTDKENEWIVYAQEADVLNVAIFGCTAKQWREANPTLALEERNIRDMASINELTVLANLENTNSLMIESGIDNKDKVYKA